MVEGVTTQNCATKAGEEVNPAGRKIWKEEPMDLHQQKRHEKNADVGGKTNRPKQPGAFGPMRVCRAPPRDQTRPVCQRHQQARRQEMSQCRQDKHAIDYQENPRMAIAQVFWTAWPVSESEYSRNTKENTGYINCLQRLQG